MNMKEDPILTKNYLKQVNQGLVKNTIKNPEALKLAIRPLAKLLESKDLVHIEKDVMHFMQTEIKHISSYRKLFAKLFETKGNTPYSSMLKYVVRRLAYSYMKETKHCIRDIIHSKMKIERKIYYFIYYGDLVERYLNPEKYMRIREKKAS